MKYYISEDVNVENDEEEALTCSCVRSFVELEHTFILTCVTCIVIICQPVCLFSVTCMSSIQPNDWHRICCNSYMCMELKLEISSWVTGRGTG